MQRNANLEDLEKCCKMRFFLAIVAVDTAENEPSKVSGLDRRVRCNIGSLQQAAGTRMMMVAGRVARTRFPSLPTKPSS